MPPDSTYTHFDLLVFTVPGLPDLSLAVAMIETLESTDLMPSTPVPLAPPAVLGLSNWQGTAVTVVDLAQLLLCDRSVPLAAGDCRFLVVQVIVNGKLDYVAWPILPGATIYRASAQIPQAKQPDFLNPALVRASIVAGDRSLILLNLDQLTTIVRQQLTKLHSILTGE
jgi:chemotaxis signal transduction protein